MSKEYEKDQTTFIYEETEKGIEIKGVKGNSSQIEIPASIEGKEVFAIGKKAFLSLRGLYGVTLPDTIEEVGEWAFAYSKTLEEVSMPGKDIFFGKNIFLGCEGLRKITFRDSFDKSYGEDVSYLTAKAMVELNAPFLCNPMEAGSADWFRMYDDRLLDFLKKDDMEGFSELWTCGEEDYEGKDYDAVSYPNERRKEKVRACFFRLIHADGLSMEVKETISSYLIEHTVGRVNEETWEVIEEGLGSSYDHYRLFVETGCLTDDNFDEIMNRLQRLSERDVTKQYPEMKAYFIRSRQEEETVLGDAFFDAFDLDAL